MSSKPHQVIFLNGPRRSGKDQAAKYIIAEFISVRHKKFAGIMKRALKEFFGIKEDLWKRLEHEGSGQLKLQPLPELLGMSWVEALIWFSEEVMKPKFGSDVFGQLLAREMIGPTSNYLTVISDSRFTEEALPVVEAYGPTNCHVFQLFRDDLTFMGDTGSYMCATDFPAGVTFWRIDNIHELSMYRRQILIRTNKVLGQENTYD